MKRIFAISFFIFSAFQIGFAQLEDNEINSLRKHVKLSDKDVVRVNERQSLNFDTTLKVYLAIDRPGDEKKYFEKRIKEWNEKDGAQYGKLEQVSDISQADIILAQFVETRTKRVGETSVSVKNIPLPGQADAKNVRIGNGAGYVSLKLPVYSYLLKREGNIWTVLYGGVETSIYGDQLTNPEVDLWNAYTKRRKDL